MGNVGPAKTQVAFPLGIIPIGSFIKQCQTVENISNVHSLPPCITFGDIHCTYIEMKQTSNTQGCQRTGYILSAMLKLSLGPHGLCPV